MVKAFGFHDPGSMTSRGLAAELWGACKTRQNGMVWASGSLKAVSTASARAVARTGYLYKERAARGIQSNPIQSLWRTPRPTTAPTAELDPVRG